MDETAPQEPKEPIIGTCRSCGAEAHGFSYEQKFSYGTRQGMKWVCVGKKHQSPCGAVRYDGTKG